MSKQNYLQFLFTYYVLEFVPVLLFWTFYTFNRISIKFCYVGLKKNLKRRFVNNYKLSSEWRKTNYRQVNLSFFSTREAAYKGNANKLLT